MNGAIVGRIGGVRSEGEGARIDIQLEPDAFSRMPGDVRVRILPTTLFGQKYVELVSSDDPSRDPLRPGALLKTDSGTDATEVTEVLNRLEPQLTSIWPDELATVLGALSEGLSGRGSRLGETISLAEHQLSELNANSDDLVADLKLLEEVSRNYEGAAPDMVAILRNATKTSQTLTSRRRDLAASIDETASAAKALDRLVRANEARIIELNTVSRPIAALLADYSSQTGCVLRGFLEAKKITGKTFRNGWFHTTLSWGRQFEGYTADDAPVYGEVGAGPSCRGLPDAKKPYPDSNPRDGVSNTEAPFGGVLPPLLPSGAQ